MIDDVMPRRILIVIPNWVGDVVMATAALRAIRQYFSQAAITHLMRPYVAQVLAGTRLSDAQLFWPGKSIADRPGARSNSAGSTAESQPAGTTDAEQDQAIIRAGWVGHLDLVRRLRSERFDLAILLTNSFRSALIARLAGIPQRVGYARDGRGWLLTDRLIPMRENGRYLPVSALDYYNTLAGHLGCDDVNDQLVLATRPEDERRMDQRLKPTGDHRRLVVLNPGANYGSAKCWPAEKYAALSDELVTRYGIRVVASLGPKEHEIADRMRAAARQPIDIFIDPPLGLGPLRALIRRCDLLITNDTGPRHFAAAFGVPVVTIFGSSDPAWTDTRYALERIVKLDLECQPCMKRVCPLQHHDCMRRLGPERVLEQVDEFLGHRQMHSNSDNAQKTPTSSNQEIQPAGSLKSPTDSLDVPIVSSSRVIESSKRVPRS